MVHDALTNPFSGKQMFEEATEVGDELELTRPDLDRWALRSHERAIQATDEGRLPEEIVPVTVKGRKGDTVVEVDEAPRRGSTLEALAKLPGLAGKEGSHTAGNSPGVNDGAGALVVASEEWAERNGKEALAEVVAHAQSANDFAYLATTPARAAMKALDKAGLQPGDIDLWEINEAFASVAINSIRMLGIDEERVNVNGGAVALGHPVGASGARILGALVHELRRRGGGYGCAAICSGGGQGDAVILKVVRPDRGSSFHHAVSPAPQSAGSESRAAAFFDLDRTLMAGSSGFHWARAAYRAGLLTRRQIAADAWANLQFRLRGSTDAETDGVRARLGSGCADAASATSSACRPGARRRAAAPVPADAADRLRPPGRGPPGLHLHRRLPGARRTCSPTSSASTAPPAAGWRSATGRTPGASTAPSATARASPFGWPSSPPATAWTSPCPTPTPTPPPTCRCCARSAIPSR